MALGKKPKLLLHVGSHKTGTTSIQATLAKNRTLLKDNGILYPDTKPFFRGGSDAHHDIAHYLADKEGYEKVLADEFVNFLKMESNKYDKILLSAEPFYRHVILDTQTDISQVSESEFFRGREVYLKRVESFFKDFDVEVILFLRRQDDFAESLYKNCVVSAGFCGGFDKHLNYSKFKHNYNYTKQIEVLSKVFGETAADSYEKNLERGIVDGFLDRIGVTASAKFSALEHEFMRRSISNKATLWIDRSKEVSKLSKRDVRRRWHFSVAVQLPLLVRDRTTFWPSREVREAFLERYRNPNLELFFPPLGGEMGSMATLSDAEFSSLCETFSEWEARNADYLRAREIGRLPPYALDEPPEGDSTLAGVTGPPAMLTTREKVKKWYRVVAGSSR